MKYVIGVVILLSLVVAGCQIEQVVSFEDELDLIGTDSAFTDTAREVDASEIDPTRVALRIRAVEGDLIQIPMSAFDPDGGEVTLAFQNPFNSRGLWQTRFGDEGAYLVEVTASDGLDITTEVVLVEVTRANRPPVIECPETITVNEGERVMLNCNIYDPDGDSVVVSYEGWMRASSYLTRHGDRGEHTVLIRASDSVNEVTQTLTVVVNPTPRAPVIEALADQSVRETDLFTVTPQAYDPDGNPLTITFSEPLDENGEWRPDYGDRGTYEIRVSAFDGQLTTTETFTLTVTARNRAPVLRTIPVLEVNEGEMVVIPVEAYDPDGDDLLISYSGWMDSRTRQTTHDDAHPLGCGEPGCTATYFTTVTVSDGELETSQIVEIRVKDVNRPPVFTYD